MAMREREERDITHIYDLSRATAAPTPSELAVTLHFRAHPPNFCQLNARQRPGNTSGGTVLGVVSRNNVRAQTKVL